MDVVKRAVAAVEARARRVSLVLKADIRPGVTDGLTSKVETVERHLAEGGTAAGRRASPGTPPSAPARPFSRPPPG